MNVNHNAWLDVCVFFFCGGLKRRTVKVYLKKKVKEKEKREIKKVAIGLLLCGEGGDNPPPTGVDDLQRTGM